MLSLRTRCLRSVRISCSEQLALARGQDDGSEEADATSLTHTDSFDHTHRHLLARNAVTGSMKVNLAWDTMNTLVFAHVHCTRLGLAAAYLVRFIYIRSNLDHAQLCMCVFSRRKS
jgi:hypothetical protein